MASGGDKTFVGFGFGPIQSGLFCCEAQRSGRFGRCVIAEVDADLVRAVRDAGGTCTVNVARHDRVDAVRLTDVELCDPSDPDGRETLVRAIADSDEMATALPSIDFYDRGSASVARLLAEGLSRRDRRRPTVIYAAENHNHAAEALRDAVSRHASPGALDAVRPVNTVIGKMSGVIDDPETMRRLGLQPLTPGAGRAVLVEEFNRILISRVELPGFRRGIEVFREKPDLLPFEEAKLYGHNAIHALIGYLADLSDLTTIAEAGKDDPIMTVAREAFLAESGRTLCRRHGDLGDELFTPDGWRRYADDLLERMTNPRLNDRVDRVCRDPIRKLGYDDRLYGTMNLALHYDVAPQHLARGAAAALVSMVRRRDELDRPPAALPQRPDELTGDRPGALLREIWGADAGDNAPRLIALTRRALQDLGAG